jgi:hypothetical protein
MERTKIIFCSAENSNCEHDLEAFYNANGNLTISIKDPKDNSGYYFMHIELDRLTAIKFVKHLKREISYMGSEVNNG